MGIRSYFRGGRLVRMSDGSRCIIRDLGLVKGGKGLRHFECLLRLSIEGVFSKLAQVLRIVARTPDQPSLGESPLRRRGRLEDLKT
jgi:hypothetical protein